MTSTPEARIRSPRIEEPPERWHALPPEGVLDRLSSSADGLSAAEAERRLRQHGPNLLRATRPASAWAILLAQLRSVVVLLLAAAGSVAFLMGDRIEAAAIGAVLAINTLIGFVVELRARRAMEALLRHQVPEATALREGAARRIPADRLVPGDVIEVGEGEAIPADARLLDAPGVRTTEAALTGESTPMDKAVDPVADAAAPLAERASMLYTGTAVSVGRARAVVVATGMDTELGRIGRLVEGIEEQDTPLERRLDTLGHRLVGLTVGIAGLVVGAGLLRGTDAALMVQTGIALAIAAVPEGLPVVATIALAVGLRRMARRQVAVRRLSAVEALGSTTVVCTDKTGTLTAGQMTVTRVTMPSKRVDVTGSGYDREGELLVEGEVLEPEEESSFALLVRAAALTPRAETEAGELVRGDPTDAALLVFARKAGLDREDALERWPQVDEIPFSSEARLSVSIHRVDDGTVAFVKGSPGSVLARSSAVTAHGDVRPLDAEVRQQLERSNVEMADEGLRVIALAFSDAPQQAGQSPEDLTFLGLVGMADPPAEGVRETVEMFRQAGIRTVMITGDQAATARAVAGALGMAGQEGEEVEEGHVLDGRDIAPLDDRSLQEAVGRVDIFSRVSPDEKLRIVAALRARGEVVAMLGDGVNDAAALKRADVGVAMGVRGTDVAKETADLVLRDDRFRTIAAAVEEGRVIFDNIRKFVFYLFSCNLAELLVVMGGSLAGLPLPLLPLQILWLNLVTDTFPALALAIEPGEPDVMRRPPRDPDATILSRRFVASLGFFALLITAASLGGYVWALGSGPPERAGTVAFMTLALGQLFHLGNARSRLPVLRPSRIVGNRWALGAVGLVLVLQLLTIYWPPLARVLETTRIGPTDWMVVLGLSLVPAVVGQGLRSIRRVRAPTG